MQTEPHKPQSRIRKRGGMVDDKEMDRFKKHLRRNAMKEEGILLPDKEVQTRNTEGETLFFETIKEAFQQADLDPTVWKISWSDPDTEERVRFVREEENAGWKFELLADVIALYPPSRD